MERAKHQRRAPVRPWSLAKSYAPNSGRPETWPEARLTGTHQSRHPVRRASSLPGRAPARPSKVQEGRISPALLPVFAVYDTAEQFDWSTCVALTGGKGPNTKGERQLALAPNPAAATCTRVFDPVEEIANDHERTAKFDAASILAKLDAALAPKAVALGVKHELLLL